MTFIRKPASVRPRPCLHLVTWQLRFKQSSVHIKAAMFSSPNTQIFQILHLCILMPNYIQRFQTTCAPSVSGCCHSCVSGAPLIPQWDAAGRLSSSAPDSVLNTLSSDRLSSDVHIHGVGGGGRRRWGQGPALWLCS